MASRGVQVQQHHAKLVVLPIPVRRQQHLPLHTHQYIVPRPQVLKTFQQSTASVPSEHPQTVLQYRMFSVTEVGPCRGVKGWSTLERMRSTVQSVFV